MSPIRYQKYSFSTSVTVFLAIVFALAIPVVTVAQYYNFGNPAATDSSTTPLTDYPSASYPTVVSPAATYPALQPSPGQYAGTTVPTYSDQYSELQQYPGNQQPVMIPNPAVANPPPISDQQYAGQQYAGLQVGQAVPASSQQVPQQPQQVWLGQTIQQQSEQEQVPPFTPPQGTNDTGTPVYQSPYAALSNDIPQNPAPMDVPAFTPPTGGNFDFDIPVFQPPQFTPPSQPQEGNEPPLLALGGVGNAYTPYSGTGQAGGAVPAFRTPGTQESLANQGLVARERERRDDRRLADQEYIETWNEIRDKKNTEAWKMRMPPYAGPLENRTGQGDEESYFTQASYFAHTIKQDDYEYDWEREEKHSFDFSMLDPTRFGERVKVWVGLGPDEEKARKYMEEALDLMKQEKYTAAAKKFEWAAYYWQESAVEEDARYHAAECYYREKRFSYAVAQYTKLLENFPSSPYKTEAIHNTYEIARTWIKQVTEDKVSYINVSSRSRPTFDTFGYAERALKTIFINCPNDPLADDSVFLLAHGYMRLGRAQGDASFEHAAEYFKQLRDCYPNSEFVVEAMRLEVLCREKAGLGADYDARHIDEAIKIADQLRQQHGTRMPSDQRNELVQISNHLNEEKAKKLWVTAKFYDDRYDYGAARLGYLELIDKYPTTEYAEKARKRYEQIRNRPAELPSDWQRIKSVFRIKWE